MEYMAACPGGKHSSQTFCYTPSDPAETCDGFNPVDADWFKIAESVTYDGLWVTEKIYKDGQWPIKIPTDLKPGCAKSSTVVRTNQLT